VRDKFPLKQNVDDWDFRIAPIGSVRYGAYIGPAATIMPAYVNIGAWIGPNTLIDTWVSIGTCCQIGAGVTILPGASVIGSLYPLDSIPAIIEDGCYIGSNCVIGSGVLVSEGAYLDSGVVVTRSTPIVDLTTDKVELTTGLIPANAIVAAGTWSLHGSVSVAAALVTGYREPPMSPSVSLGESIAQRLAAVDHR
jgi:2,3,4,5-tetrahydropyridine-2-carboxylate N-succinyltransferase